MPKGLCEIYGIAMSGGVDSSVAAAIIQQSGNDAFGVTMITTNDCDAIVENAAKICRKLSIEHFVVDLRTEFKKYVMDMFAWYYSNGMTPNPCAICNREIKLRLLQRFAQEKGATLLATGHYVKLIINNGDSLLMESPNIKKDQSYFLALVRKEDLKNIRFPLCDITDKNETREIARSLGFHNFANEDSQDICFINNGNYRAFLQENYAHLSNHEAGEICLYDSNNVIGKHKGIMNYTIGQRKGLGISYNEPLYVTNLDPMLNRVIVDTRRNSQCNYEFSVSNVNWLIDSPESFLTTVKLRSICGKVKARITKSNNNSIKVKLLELPKTPVTAGQICVMYTNNHTIIGGGTIDRNSN